jgi:hypothetical protein
MKLPGTLSATAFVLFTAAVALAQTPPPKITPSDEPPGKEAGKTGGGPGASWSDAAKHDKQGTDGSGGNAAPSYAKQKAADKKSDGGPVVIPPPAAKAN